MGLIRNTYKYLDKKITDKGVGTKISSLRPKANKHYVQILDQKAVSDLELLLFFLVIIVFTEQCVSQNSNFLLKFNIGPDVELIFNIYIML